jgi:predicted molibdopterin-dependent oxidoreductase YjgC
VVRVLRITEHPILRFEHGPLVRFTFDGRELEGVEGEAIAAALHAAGVRVLSHSHGLHRPRGFYCAIGNCSSCLMMVDGEPNVRVCVEKLSAGMRVETQSGKGRLRMRADDYIADPSIADPSTADPS